MAAHAPQILATHVYMAGVLRSSDLTDGQVIRTGVANTPATNVTVTINSTGVFLTATNTVKVRASAISTSKSPRVNSAPHTDWTSSDWTSSGRTSHTSLSSIQRHRSVWPAKVGSQ